MATIGKFFSSEANNESQDILFKRVFFPGVIYGGPNDTEKGVWKSHKVAILVFVDPVTEKWADMSEEKIKELSAANGGYLERGSVYKVDGISLLLKSKVVSWQVVYFVEDNPKDGMSKTFLLKNSVFDEVNNIKIPLNSDVREWANANIMDRVLDKEWTKNLADLLNQRGAIFEEVKYLRKKEDGGKWVATALNVHFADTYNK